MVLAGKRSGDASRRLDASISAYLADTSRLTRTNEQAYITGTLVFFDKATQTIPHSGSQLTVDPAIAYDAYQNPEGISMADIGTIIVVDYEDKKVFTYNDGTPAYQTTCDLTVVDKTRDAIVDQKSFIGPLPPSSFTCKIGAVNTCPDSVSGGYPSKEMKEYIDSLPPK
jgi:hypothetical protein